LIETRKRIGMAAKKALGLHASWSTTEALLFMGWLEPSTVSVFRQIGLVIRMLGSGEEMYRNLMRSVLLEPLGGAWRKRLELSLCELEKKENFDDFGGMTFWQELVDGSDEKRKKWYYDLKRRHGRRPHGGLIYCRENSGAVFRIWSRSLKPWEREKSGFSFSECELCGKHEGCGDKLVLECEDEVVEEVVRKASCRLKWLYDEGPERVVMTRLRVSEVMERMMKMFGKVEEETGEKELQKRMRENWKVIGEMCKSLSKRYYKEAIGLEGE